MSRKRDRRSWPLVWSNTSPIFSGRSFENEDAPDIPEPFRATIADLTNPEHLSLHAVLLQCKELGRDFKPSKDSPQMTIKQRQASFTEGWRGPCPDLMAECGLYEVSPECACCYSCNVTLRGLNDPDICVWTRHSDFAPYCRHVRRVKEHGHPHEGVQLRARRFSTDGGVNVL